MSKLLLDRIAMPVLAAIMLIVGLSTYSDYGLVFDDSSNLYYGRCWYQAYTAEEPPKCLTSQHTFIHSPLFELIQTGVAEVFHVDRWGGKFRTRHLVNFLLATLTAVAMYYAAGLFELETGYRLAACLMFVVSPRLYAHYFYNSVDTGAAAFMLFSFIAMVKFFDKPNLIRAFLLGVVFGLAVAVRLTSLLMMAMAITLLAVQAVSAALNAERSRCWQLIGWAGVIVLAAAAVIYPAWPNLWYSPITAIGRIFGETTALNVSIHRHYLGQDFGGKQPWHYNLVWIAITLPITYLLFFGIGAAKMVRDLFKKPFGSRLQLLQLALLVWVIIPLGATVVLRPTLYGDWRHHYFLFPAIVLIAGVGLRAASGWKITVARFRIAAASVLFAGDLAVSVSYMIQNHPYQGLYFSPLIGGLPGAEGRFEIDYWGTSYKEALARLVSLDNRQQLRCVFTPPVMSNARFLLPPEQIPRIIITPPEEAEYYFSLVTSLPVPPPGDGWRELFNVRNQGVLLLTVYHRQLPAAQSS